MNHTVAAVQHCLSFILSYTHTLKLNLKKIIEHKESNKSVKQALF